MKTVTFLMCAALLFAATASPAVAKENGASEPPRGNERSDCRRMPGAQASSDAKERKGKPETPPGQDVSEGARNADARCGIGALPRDD